MVYLVYKAGNKVKGKDFFNVIEIQCRVAEGKKVASLVNL